MGLSFFITCGFLIAGYFFIFTEINTLEDTTRYHSPPP